MSWFPWLVGIIGVVGAGCSAGVLVRLRSELRNCQEAEAAGRERAQREQERVQERLNVLSEEYEALMTGCGAGVLVVETDVIERANSAAGQLLGAPSPLLEGRPLLEATLSGELNSLVKQARDQNSVQRCEIRALGVSGSCLSVTVLPIPNANNGQNSGKTRCVVVAHDVTELRRLETVRRDFVANVSHELRTPLTSIRAMAETLQDGALRDGEVADHFLGIINSEAQRLTRISEDLLILSQAESRLPETVGFSISALLLEVVNRFLPRAEKEKLSLCADIPSGLEVNANHDQIEQVLVNLIDNALKYTPGGGRVEVTAERRGDMIAVHIADTGIGILTQDVPRIFERFYRVDKARSRQSGGTGLGLSIVKHIVEAHGGQITVESDYNRGSTFTFTLPSAS